MAKIKFSETPFIGVIFDGELDLKVDQDHERAVYTDMSTGAKVIFYGDNLKESASDEGHFKAGTVDKVVFKTGDGDVLITATEGDYKATNFNAALDADGVSAIYYKLLGGDDRIEGGSYNERLEGEKGDDRIIGGKGDDSIYGGAGDDVLTGGNQTDHFYFEHNGVEHDRITDFDIAGGNMDVLQVGWDIDKIGKTNNGKDTLITFDNGSTLELDGVTKADFVDYLNANPIMD